MIAAVAGLPGEFTVDPRTTEICVNIYNRLLTQVIVITVLQAENSIGTMKEKQQGFTFQ